MRLFIDVLIVLMLTAILAGYLRYQQDQRQRQQQQASVQEALQRLADTTAYHRTLEQLESENPKSAPVISAMWFGDRLPRNTLIPSRHPWLDLAPPNDQAKDPPDPVVIYPTQAGFWYNPNNRVFRARVLPQETEQATLDLYNQINRSNLTSLNPSPDPDRQPLPYANQDRWSTASANSAPTGNPIPKPVTAVSERRSLLDASRP